MPALYVTAPADALELLLNFMQHRTDVILIDGRSGAGKTSLARGLQRAAVVHGIPAQLVHIEQVYQGWDGLAGAAAAVAESLVVPFSEGRAGYWDEYDWERERVIRRHEVVPHAPLIVEGVGALHPRAAAAARAKVWVTTDDATRQIRALARDGDSYRPHWDRWARQEEAFLDEHGADRLADLVVDTTYVPRIG